MRRYYSAENITSLQIKEVAFKRTEVFAGCARGVYTTTEDWEIFHLDALSAIPSGVRQITRAEYAAATGEQPPEDATAVIKLERKGDGPLYTISVVCYKNLALTQACLQSVLRYSADYELIVTDNASNDGTAEFLKSLQSTLGDKLTVISNPANKGFIEPNNHALTLARAEHFVTLNNDMEVCAGWLDVMASAFAKNPRVAIVGIAGTCSEIDDGFHGGPGPRLDYIEASCLMIKTELARQHGLFSPYLKFAYQEDCDLGLRMQSLGYELATVKLPLHHNKRSSTSDLVIREGKIPLREYADANRKEMQKRWGGWIKTRNFPDVRILIHRRGAHGDVLFTTPIAEALKKHKYPKSQIIVTTDCPEIYQNNPHAIADRITPKGFSPDLTFDLDSAYENQPKKHVIDAYAEACGLKDVGRGLRLYPSEDDTQFALATIKTQPTCLIHAGPTLWPGRNWKEKRWEELAEELWWHGWKVIFVGAKGNYAPPKALSLAGKTTIHQLYEICMEATLFIGIDSLPFNIAQAAGTPAVGLFGTINPEYRLCSPKARGVHGDPEKVPCIFEHHRLKPPVTHSSCDGKCMAAISVEMVLKKLPEVLHA